MIRRPPRPTLVPYTTLSRSNTSTGTIKVEQTGTLTVTNGSLANAGLIDITDHGAATLTSVSVTDSGTITITQRDTRTPCNAPLTYSVLIDITDTATAALHSV